MSDVLVYCKFYVSYSSLPPEIVDIVNHFASKHLPDYEYTFEDIQLSFDNEDIRRKTIKTFMCQNDIDDDYIIGE